MLNLSQRLLHRKSGFKGIGNIIRDCTDIQESWNITKDDVSLPAATLSRSTIEHNLLWMKKFAEIFNYQLAPHGKTTMLPELFTLQVSSGCWGMTLATVSQVLSAHKAGVSRVIMANQLVGDCNMDIISTIMNDEDFEFICLVDSSENVAQLGNFFQARKQKIKVLLEYGPMGGRTGIRNDSQERSILAELEKWKATIDLVGVEFFEGVLKDEHVIRQFTQYCLSRITFIARKGAFASDEVIISGAGTSWFDVIAEEFAAFEMSTDLRLKKILRSGCYLIYDYGLYHGVQERVLKLSLGQGDENYAILGDTLKPALKIWAYVQSIPEPDLAIIGMGKRDVAIDCGFPVPDMQFRKEGYTRTLLENTNMANWSVFNMMDQHTFMKINEGDDIRVGDMISFDIYHPCTTMDKWKNVLVVDDDLNVIDIYFSEF